MLEGAKAAGWRGSRRGKSGRCLSEKNFDTASRSRVSLHGGTRAFLSRIRRCPSACSAHSVEGTGIRASGRGGEAGDARVGRCQVHLALRVLAEGEDVPHVAHLPAPLAGRLAARVAEAAPPPRAVVAVEVVAA